MNFTFGTTQPASTGFSFGGTTQPASTGFSFGGTSATTQPATSGFSWPTTGTTAPATTQAVPPPMPPAVLEIKGHLDTFKSWYTVYLDSEKKYRNKFCRFKKLLYNDVDTRTREAYAKAIADRNVVMSDPFFSLFTQQQWRHAQDSNPDRERLAPCPLIGFGEMTQRLKDADTVTREIIQDLKSRMKRRIRSLQQHTDVIEAKLESCRVEHRRLAHRLLTMMRKMEVLVARGRSLTPEEHVLRQELESLHRQLNAPMAFKAKLGELVALQKLQEERPAEFVEQLDDGDVDRVVKILEMQSKGLEHLVATLKRDSRHVKLIQNVLTEGRDKDDLMDDGNW